MVTEAKGQQLADVLGYTFKEASAKDGKGVSEVSELSFAAWCKVEASFQEHSDSHAFKDTMIAGEIVQCLCYKLVISLAQSTRLVSKLHIFSI